jgi:exodeoxyribonuclease V alpha subunit
VSLLEACAPALGPVDLETARALGRIAGESDDVVLAAVALASRAVQHGHVCADLPRLMGTPLLDRDENELAVSWPELGPWRAALLASPLCARMPEDCAAPLVRRPLIIDACDRVYLFRYADYQRRLAIGIARKLAISGAATPELAGPLSKLFGDDPRNGQRLAAQAALAHRFATISGGPGTGKTTTVVRIMALLHEASLARGGTLAAIRLVAPTGKAAQRLGESARAQLDALDCRPEVREALGRAAADASTIHRLLGYRARTPTRFHHGPARPVPYDTVIVDEASMIDAALMCKLLEAVPPDGRCILLGDKDQLASVEAGAIFGDLYDAGLGAAAQHLDRSWRYADASGIGELAGALRRGDGDGALQALGRGDVTLAPIDHDDPLAGPLGDLVLERLRAWFAKSDAGERLAMLGAFRVLCAHRHGPSGALAINAAIERRLKKTLGICTETPYYDGRPILVTRNDYQLGLYNGDVGVIAGDGRSALFATDGGTRSFAVARLPAHESVYAMTVHKSQGSELEEVAVVLPPRMSPVLTRELVYTAVTRARRRVHLFGAADLLRAAVARRVERASGLADALRESIAPGGSVVKT